MHSRVRQPQHPVGSSGQALSKPGGACRYNTDPEYKKKVDEDKRARAQAERAADPPVSLFDIILPVAPFGIPGAQHRYVLVGALQHHPGEVCRLSLRPTLLPQ